MNIVIDMNLSPEWEAVFPENYLCVHWSRIGKSDAPDEEILQWAKKHGYVILTNDLDFGAILAATHLDGPSVFQIRSLVLDPLIIGESVARCFQAFEDDLRKGALLSFHLERSRVRRLPFA